MPLQSLYTSFRCRLPTIDTLWGWYFDSNVLPIVSLCIRSFTCKRKYQLFRLTVNATDMFVVFLQA